MEQKKIKAVWFNDSSKTREFTKEAFGYVTNPKGWIQAEDQSGVGVEKKTGPGVAPAALASHNEAELNAARAEYKKVSGKDPDLKWNEPRLFIETQKAANEKKNEVKIDLVDAVKEVEPVKEEVKNEPIATKTTRKYNKKEKTQA